MAIIKPFKITTPQAQINDLYERLRQTIMPSEIKGAGWSYGPTNAYIQDMIDTLLTDYDWSTHEAKLNKHPQFTTELTDKISISSTSNLQK